MISILAALTFAPVPILHRTDVFVSGEGGYHTYRIPAIIEADNGHLLAFCEGRRDGRGDAGDIDLLMKRSRDGGRTWSDTEVIWNDGPNTCGNPCPVLDRDTGTIHLLMTHNLGTDREAQIIRGESKGTRTVWVTASRDDGRTWTEPTDITATTKLDDWTWYATGPGAGIQIETGIDEGRLVIPCDHIEAETRNYHSHVIYSDDHGLSWRLGGSSPDHQVNECEVVERIDGSLLLNMRNYDRTKKTRQTCISEDGGESWTRQRHDDALVEPICQASIRRLSWSPSLIAFSNPASTEDRRRMTVRFSTNEGRSWTDDLLVHDGGAAYSCLVALPDEVAGLLYEADGYARIEFVTFDIEPLLDRAGAP